MQCKYFPHECVGSYWVCPLAKELGCCIKPIILEVREHEQELKQLLKEAA